MIFNENALKQMFEQKIIKKGQFHKIIWASKEDNGYVKVSSSVVRFVDYPNLKSVKDRKQAQAMANKPTKTYKPNPNVTTLIKYILEYNSNTQNALLHCYPIPKRKNMTKSKYYDNHGNEITKEQYETMVTVKKSNGGEKDVYKLKVQNILYISGAK